MVKQPDPVAVEIQKLRIAISRLTGRLPVSMNRRYLEQRLSDLKKRKDAGEDVHHDNGEPSAPISLSMTRLVRDMLARLADDAKVSASEIVRRALVEYARTHGRKADARHVETTLKMEQAS